MKKSKKELYDDEAILNDFKSKKILFVFNFTVIAAILLVVSIIFFSGGSDYFAVAIPVLICAVFIVCLLIYGVCKFNKAIKTQEELVRRAKRTDSVDEKMAQLETELAQLKRERSGESPSISDDDPPEDKDIGE